MPSEPNRRRCFLSHALPIRRDSTWYRYGWDLTKSICEIYSTASYIRTVYTYLPYGEVTLSGSVAQNPRWLVGGLDKPKGFAPQGRGRNGVRPSQHLQWSSEYIDTELGLVYYNYRYYNSTDGRWTRREPIMSISGENLYKYINNQSIEKIDKYGLCPPGYNVCQARCVNVRTSSANPAKYRATCCNPPSFALKGINAVTDIPYLYDDDISGDNAPMIRCCKVNNDGYDPSTIIIGALIIVGIGVLVYASAGTAAPIVPALIAL